MKGTIPFPPYWLEIGRYCREYKVSPAVFGFDAKDPKVWRWMDMAWIVWDTALSRKRSENKSEWDKINKEMKKLLDFASGHVPGGATQKSDDPMEVQIEVPVRPRSRRKNHG